MLAVVELDENSIERYRMKLEIVISMERDVLAMFTCEYSQVC